MKTSVASVLSLVVLSAAPVRGQDGGVLFPAAFSVEHQLVQTDASGGTFRTQPVVDTYGGSTLVSVRPGGSRVIVDFAKRTATEVSVEKSTYWTLSFSQMGDLSRRLAKADARPSTAAATSLRAPDTAAPPDVRVEDVTDATRDRLAAPSGPTPRAGTRHLRAFVPGGLSADVWVDGAVRLSKPALDALESFEREALGGGEAGVTPARLAAAARRAADGSVPVRVRRPLGAGGFSEDVVTALTPLPAFPQKLLAVGEGFRRVASPLEEMVAFAEDEARHDSSRLVK